MEIKPLMPRRGDNNRGSGMVFAAVHVPISDAAGYITFGSSGTFLSPEGTSLCGRRCDTLPP